MDVFKLCSSISTESEVHDRLVEAHKLSHNIGKLNTKESTEVFHKKLNMLVPVYFGYVTIPMCEQIGLFPIIKYAPWKVPSNSTYLISCQR